MDRRSKKHSVTLIVACGMAFVVGAPASAGTLYSWITEDGTYAYTNEKKRVPARYKGEAKTSKLGKMEAYPRYTPGPRIDDRAYADRIVERLEMLRGQTAGLATASSVQDSGAASVQLGLGGSVAQIEIPVGAGNESGEPVVVEDVRMQKDHGRQSTRHYKVVRQGERVLAVIKDRVHDGPPDGAIDEKDLGISALQ